MAPRQNTTEPTPDALRDSAADEYREAAAHVEAGEDDDARAAAYAARQLLADAQGAAE